MPLEQMRRSTSASERRSSKRPLSLRATTSGLRSQCSAKNSSVETGSMQRARARFAVLLARVCGVCVRVARIGVRVIGVGVRVLIVLVLVSGHFAPHLCGRAPALNVVVPQAGHRFLPVSWVGRKATALRAAFAAFSTKGCG